MFVSASAPTITATFRIVPVCSGRTLIVTVTFPPTGMVPIAQVTSCPELEHVPCVELDERSLTVAGSESVITTCVAVLGPCCAR